MDSKSLSFLPAAALALRRATNARGFSLDHPPCTLLLSALKMVYQWGSAAKNSVSGNEAMERLASPLATALMKSSMAAETRLRCLAQLSVLMIWDESRFKGICED